MLTVETELTYEAPNYIWHDIKSFSPISPYKDNCLYELNNMSEIELISDPPPLSHNDKHCRHDFSSPPTARYTGVRKAMWQKERLTNLMNQHLTIAAEKKEVITKSYLANMIETIILFNFKNIDFVGPRLKDDIMQEYINYIKD